MAQNVTAAAIEAELKSMLQLTQPKDSKPEGKQLQQQGDSTQREPGAGAPRRVKKARHRKKKDIGEGSADPPTQVPCTGDGEKRSPSQDPDYSSKKSEVLTSRREEGNDGVAKFKADNVIQGEAPRTPTMPPPITTDEKDKRRAQTTPQDERGDGKTNFTSKKTSSGRKGSIGGKEEGDKVLLVTDPKILEELEISGIFPLKRKSARFPRANFFCRVCEFHCDMVPDCRQHMKDRRHGRRLEISKGDKQLRSLPKPSVEHIEALNSTVRGLVSTYGLSNEDMERRKCLVTQLETYLKTFLPDVTLQLYGSSVTGFGLKTSDANIDIILPQRQNAAHALVTIYKTLKEKDTYKCIQSDFKAKVPSISFVDPDSDTCYQLTVGNSHAHETTQLLATYGQIDPRVRELAITFRYWSKVCKVDQQMMGTMPAYTTSLLAIYFLQQQKPAVLPVLHEIKTNIEKMSAEQCENSYCRSLDLLANLWKTENEQPIGELWLDMIRFYSLTFSISNDVICIRQEKVLPKGDKKWSGKKLAVEDPFSRKRNVARSVSSNQVFDYIYDSLRQSYRYFGMPAGSSSTSTACANGERSHTSEEVIDDLSPDQQNRGNVDNPVPTSPLVSSPSVELFPEASKKPSGNMSSPCNEDVLESDLILEVPEDSHVTEANSDNTATSSETTADCEHLSECDRNTLRDFATNLSNSIIDKAKMSIQEADKSYSPCCNSETPSDSSIPSICKENDSGSISPCDMSSGTNSSVGKMACSSSSDQSQSTFLDASSALGDCQGMNEAEISTPTINNDRGESSEVTGVDGPITDEFIVSKVVEEFVENFVKSVIKGAICRVMESSGLAQTIAVTGEAVCVTADVLNPVENGDSCSTHLVTQVNAKDIPTEDIAFRFAMDTLTDGKGPAVVCSICQEEGHLKQACPEEKLPELPPLPELTKDYLRVLNESLKLVPRDFAPTPYDIEERNRIVSDLERFVSMEYSDARLSLFGSSCNGFGFRHSDLDICMILDQPTAEGLDCVKIIETLSRMLKEHRGLYNVLPITTAKVPIVKFRHRSSNLEGDISLYNTLAQHNTDMLQLYSMMDRRVEILGYAMKVFAKVCDIGDASRGSLSSYGYILMVLHYLQQCKPPVIPVLQELHPVGENPEVLVDGWNAWYFRHADQLPLVWEDHGKNRQNVAELWTGMFRYYTEKFDFKEQVVCIRQLAALTRFEKLWNGRCIAIEDPFDLSHNLGAGLSRKMNMYIQKAFIKGRQLYCTPVSNLKPCYNSWGDYFFDSELLTEEGPPMDKCCRACGKIGHFVKECPIVRNRKQREEEEKRKRRENNDRQQVDDRGNVRGRREQNNPQQSPQNHRNRQQQMRQSTNQRGGNGHMGGRFMGPVMQQGEKRWQPYIPMPQNQPRSDTYQVPNLSPQSGRQCSYPGGRAPSSPQAIVNPRHPPYQPYEMVSPSARPHWQGSPNSPNYYGQSPGSNQGQVFVNSNMRGQSPGKSYPGGNFQRHFPYQGPQLPHGQPGVLDGGQGRPYVSRPNDRHNSRHGGKP